MANPDTFYFQLTGPRPEPMKLDEERVPDHDWYDRNRSTRRIVNPIDGIEAVVIHATAGYATEHALNEWKTSQASAHWIVPDENEPQHGQFVWAVVSESLAAWHVRNSVTHPDLATGNKINHRSLGIEIVNTQDVQNYTDPYSDWQIVATALIVRYAWSRYPNLRHVISHARLDPGRRGDPGRQFPWDRFRSLVLSDANDPQRRPASVRRLQPA